MKRFRLGAVAAAVAAVVFLMTGPAAADGFRGGSRFGPGHGFRGPVHGFGHSRLHHPGPFFHPGFRHPGFVPPVRVFRQPRGLVWASGFWFWDGFGWTWAPGYWSR
jgi:hypothetical protein